MEEAIQKFILQTLSSKSKFKPNAQKLKDQIIKNDKQNLNALEIAKESLLRVFNSDQFPAIAKLYSLRLIQELMQMNHPDIYQMIKENFLEIIQTICYFNIESKEQDRGKFIFGQNSSSKDQELGISYLILALECIYVWSIQYQEDQQFFEAYKNLKDMGVAFPQQINYFKTNELSKSKIPLNIKQQQTYSISSLKLQESQKQDNILEIPIIQEQKKQQQDNQEIILNLQNKIQQLQNIKEQLEKDKENFQLKMIEQQKQQNELDNKLQEQVKLNLQIEKIIETQKKEIQKMEEKNKILSSKIEGIQKCEKEQQENRFSQSELTKLEKDYNFIREENLKLKQQIQQNQDDFYQKLGNKDESFSTSKIQGLEEKIKNNIEEFQMYEKKLNQQQEEISTNKLEKQKLLEEVQEMKNVVTLLRNDLQNKNNELEKLQIRSQDEKKKLFEEKAALQQQLIQSQINLKQNNNFEQKQGEIDQKNKEIMQYQLENQALKQKIETIQVQMNSISKQNQLFESKIEQLQNQLQQHNKEKAITINKSQNTSQILFQQQNQESSWIGSIEEFAQSLDKAQQSESKNKLEMPNKISPDEVIPQLEQNQSIKFSQYLSIKNEKKQNTEQKKISSNIAILQNNFEFESQLQEYQFKNSILKNRATIYNNEDLTIGVISEIQKQENKIFLKISVYFTNNHEHKSLKNFQIEYIGNQDEVEIWSNPNNPPTIINPKCQSQQELLLQFKTIPFSFLQAYVTYSSDSYNLVKVIEFILPSSIIKFLEFQPISQQEFVQLWQQHPENELSSSSWENQNKQQLQLQDIASYFQNLVNIDQDTIGGGFYLENFDVYGMIKFQIQPNLQIRLKFMTEYAQNNVKYTQLLNLFGFILSSFEYIFRNH